MQRTKYACYATNITMAAIANISPVLFLTFRELYNISYTQLGLLVLVYFSVQLLIDLVFSFFSHKFNIEKTVVATPVFAAVGLTVYALSPLIFPQNVYYGILLGTLVFSASGGLAEVLISPVIAAIPSKDPDREMSKLHSVYAWGTVFVILLSTFFILLFDAECWQCLALLLTLVPITAFVLFLGAKIPKMETPQRVSGALIQLKNKKLWLCVGAIFLGGAAECTMAQWASGYIERALGIEKLWGDIFGVAMFGLMLALGRSLYAKFGKNITKILLFGAIGAFFCYIVAAFSENGILGLAACAFTGFCVSMLWPGCLVVAQEYFKNGGVFIFAMMAAGGDFGASVGPQLVGIITDTVSASPTLLPLASQLALSPDSLGMKIGMLVGSLFPLIAVFVYWYIRRDIVHEREDF